MNCLYEVWGVAVLARCSTCGLRRKIDFLHRITCTLSWLRGAVSPVAGLQVVPAFSFSLVIQ